MPDIPTFHGFLIGVRARKSIGKEKTFRVQGGDQYQYPYTVPTDPKSDAQQSRRGVFRLAMQAWGAASEEVKDWWNAKALSRGAVCGVNLFVGDYIKEYWGL